MRKYLLTVLVMMPVVGYAQTATIKGDMQTHPVTRNAQGQLIYAQDEEGNRIPDFSTCGYGGGGVALPNVPAKVYVTPSGDDDTTLIQAALDRVAALPLNEKGLRGAVLLAPGTFRIDGQLRIAVDGVVLRGSGPGESGTTLIAVGDSRRTLIQVGGHSKPRALEGTRRTITDAYVPVGAMSLTLDSTDGYAVGDRVMVHRPSTQAWLKVFSDARPPRLPDGNRMNRQAGSRDLVWDRTIIAIDGQRIIMDAPITTAIESQYGGGTVFQYQWPQRISQVGVENLRCVSEFDAQNPKDENHSWICVAMDTVEHGWVCHLTAQHFAFSAVHLGSGTQSITVSDCRSLDPVSENAEFRRLSFYTRGQLTLFVRCEARQGRHDFTAGLNAAGPNVFLDCISHQPLSYCGPAEVWAAGTLYDHLQVKAGEIWLTDLAINAHSMGWGAANSVVWGCTAESLWIDNPPTARNWAVDCQGQEKGETPRTTGIAESLYRAQLTARRSDTALASLQPAVIDVASKDLPQQTQPQPVLPSAPAKALRIVNGRFVCGDRTVIGNSYSVNWWKGHIAPCDPTIHGLGITRYAPGMMDQGLTDDLDELTDRMAAQQIPFMQHWPGLWHERRRDDHSTAQRADEFVRAPFYEMPWARSGQGTAWDGLSRYDLFRYNSWFYERLNRFADLAAQKGLVLYHNYYNNHNLVEAAGHWADHPMRPVNCLQQTGLTEPPPYQHGGIHIADEFYDVSNEARRKIHTAYMRKTLDELGDAPNVIHSLGFQFSGPLEFQRLYLDVVKQWQVEHGYRPKIALIAAKDVTDAILNDPQYEPLIDVIDMRYWQYTKDGRLYAPAGGQNQAFRVLRYKFFGRGAPEVPPPTTPQNVYKQVREYRDRFTDKAIVCLQAGTGALPALMAGAAQVVMNESDRARLPEVYPLFAPLNETLGDKLHHMNPLDGVTGEANDVWCLAEPQQTYAVATMQGGSFELDLSAAPGDYRMQWINGTSGEVTAGKPQSVAGGHIITVTAPSDEPWLMLLIKQ